MKPNRIELKILKMVLANDDRVNQHYNYLFECNYLADVIQGLRRKLLSHFQSEPKEILFTQKVKYTKKSGKVVDCGIYRLNPVYKDEIKKIVSQAKTLSHQIQTLNKTGGNNSSSVMSEM